MDSMDLERERGITIMAKNTSVHYRDVKINIVDTPGHADFGGEVERVLKMVDGVMLLVDAAEGCLPQTRFVLRKALEARLPAIAVVNKIDRQDARPAEVVNEIYELFLDLDATDEQIEFPILYAISRDGIAKKAARRCLDRSRTAVRSDRRNDSGAARTVTRRFVATTGCESRLQRLRGAAGDRSNLLRRDATVTQVAIVKPDGVDSKRLEVSQLYVFEGLKREPVESAGFGEIVALAGVEGIDIGETITTRRKSAAAARRLPSTSRRSR